MAMFQNLTPASFPDPARQRRSLPAPAFYDNHFRGKAAGTFARRQTARYLPKCACRVLLFLFALFATPCEGNAPESLRYGHLALGPQLTEEAPALSQVGFMKSTVLIPTYHRPRDLRRCLTALEKLDLRADEVLVVRRLADEETAAVLAEPWRLPLRQVDTGDGGVVAAVNHGFDAATGDFVVITDDDAAPAPDWLARIRAHYERDPEIGAVGGRDALHVENVPIVPTGETVGLISWYGRMVGAHHLGAGAARDVHVLKGVNMSFRRAALAGHRADTRLLGVGAQVHFEIGLCTDLRRDGWKIVYDPAILVDHFPSVRHDSDKRTNFAYDAQFNKAHNEQVMILDALRGWQRPFFVGWSFLVGTSDVVGLLQLPRITAKGREAPVGRFLASWAGRAKGMATWLHTRR
jgi:hypothetical protein